MSEEVVANTAETTDSTAEVGHAASTEDLDAGAGDKTSPEPSAEDPPESGE